MSKTIICRCEDVTLDEVLKALDMGYRDIESLKRYLAIGTGPCQAKNCQTNLVRILLERQVLDTDDIIPIVSRPPVTMTPMKFYTGEKIGGEDES